ncbi:MAG: DJ-1/PfpI family protein [Geminicoccaceae bacterium]
MTQTTIGLLFIEGYADWEFGFLSGSAVEMLGARCVALTPGSGLVTSIGGLRLLGQRDPTPAENGDLAAVAVIGSDGWAAPGSPDVTALLHAVAARGGVVGGICAGTLALARAGLFQDRAHTSNGRDWLLGHVPGYAGLERYRDVPHAVADGRVISAPGTAPGTFAAAFLAALFPEREAETAMLRSLLRSEHAGTDGA